MAATAPPEPPGPPAPPAPRPHRVLRRDRSHRVLGGVAAGIARTYGVDVVLVRVLWILAAVFWIGIPAYVVAWIAIPSDDGTATVAERPRDMGLLVALALIGLGTLIAAGTWLPHFWRGGRFMAPLLLIAGGATILWLRRPTEDTAPGEPEQPADAPPAAPEPPDAGPAAAPAEPPSAWSQTAPWPTARELRRDARAERRAQRTRPFLGPLTLSVLLIGTGVAALLQALGAFELNLTVALAIATCFVGAVLVASAFVGRAHGLIFLGVLLAAAAAVSSAIDVPLHGGIGEEIHRPRTAAAVDRTYELAVGRLELDLRNVRFSGVTDVDATVGVGHLEVLLPAEAELVVDSHVGAGVINLYGQSHRGVHRDVHMTVSGDSGGTGTLHVTLRVGAGDMNIRRFQADGSETLVNEVP